LSCQKILETVHPYIDRELDPVQAAVVERHLEQCDDCDLIYRGQVALRSSLQDPSLYYRAPADLKTRIISGSEIIRARRPRARAKRDITVPTGT
jgi:anti-sigma factor RsiW